MTEDFNYECPACHSKFEKALQYCEACGFHFPRIDNDEENIESPKVDQKINKADDQDPESSLFSLFNDMRTSPDLKNTGKQPNHSQKQVNSGKGNKSEEKIKEKPQSPVDENGLTISDKQEINMVRHVAGKARREKEISRIVDTLLDF